MENVFDFIFNGVVIVVVLMIAAKVLLELYNELFR